VKHDRNYIQKEVKQQTKKCYKKEAREESIRNWQSQWEETTKGAITKEFFPSVERRLAVNLHLNTNVTTIMSGQGNIRSYLHRLKITDSPECPCKQDIQTTEHLIFQCEKLTLRLLMSYIYGAPILDVSRSHTTTQHSR